MAKTNKKTLARKRRQYKVRKKVFGTAERPRVTVFRSAKHIYAQLINDDYDQYNLDNGEKKVWFNHFGCRQFFG